MIPDQEKRLQTLLQKYRNKDISYEEYLELFEYLGNPDYKEEVLGLMDSDYKTINADAEAHDIDWDGMYQNITAVDSKNRMVKPVWKYLSAAVVVLALSFSLYNAITVKHGARESVAANTEFKNDVSPAGNKAILELGDGSRVVLGDQDEGILAREGNTAITKKHNGEIVYNTEGGKNIENVVYNTITTPRGGRYHVVLPDGSKVWLNAASSLKFPTAFKGDYRNVQLTGEAYFDVAKDKEKPFVVKAGASEIKVLGTQFNVMAHAYEAVSQTTLVEGSVQFSNEGFQRKMVPGEQAYYDATLQKSKIIKVNPEDFIAWKNNLFVFNNTSIKDIMKDISRWYDVDVSYSTQMSDTYFTGVIPRSVSITKVLKVLENAGDVKFGIDGKLITVQKSK